MFFIRGNNNKYKNLLLKRNRLEKLIANILNNDNESYSKLKQTVKENVKAVLSENKKVVPVSFTAMIQTLKADSQIINLIYNIPGTNNGDNATMILRTTLSNILNLIRIAYYI